MVDWFNPLIGHMQHSLRDPNRDHTHGRIWRITYPRRPLVEKPKIAGATVPELLDLLKSYEDRTRYRARRELREHPEPGDPLGPCASGSPASKRATPNTGDTCSKPSGSTRASTTWTSRFLKRCSPGPSPEPEPPQPASSVTGAIASRSRSRCSARW